MRMRTDYKFYSPALQPFGESALRMVGKRTVFIAPMHAGAYYFRSRRTRGIYVGIHQRAVYVVHDCAVALLYAVGAVGVVEKSDAYASDGAYVGHEPRAFGGVTVGAEV